MPKAPSRYRASLLGAVGWNAGGVLVYSAAQLILTIVLARLLGPDAFGLAAIGWAVSVPALLLADAGFGSALIQRPRLAAAEIAFYFWAQVGCGVLLAATIAGASDPIARLFGDARAQPVIVAFAAVVLANALGFTGINLLRRSMEFRRLQTIQVGSLLASYIFLGIPLALAGGGVWSLVAAAFGAAAAQSIAAYGLTRHSLRLKDPWRIARGQTIAAQYLLLNVLNVLAMEALPRLLVSRLFGISGLGLYDRAVALLVTPFDRAAAAASTVLFSSHARLAEAAADQRGVYLRSLAVAVSLSIPLAALMLTQGAFLITVALGPTWAAATTLVTPLALLIPPFFIIQVAVPVLNGRGRPAIEIVVQTGTAALLLALIPFLSASPREIAWAVVAAYLFRSLCLTLCAAYLLNIRAPGLSEGRNSLSRTILHRPKRRRVA